MEILMSGKEVSASTREKISAEVKEFKEKTGIRVWGPASIRDEATVDEAIKRGVELITCNNPDRVLEILREKGLHK